MPIPGLLQLQTNLLTHPRDDDDEDDKSVEDPAPDQRTHLRVQQDPGHQLQHQLEGNDANPGLISKSNFDSNSEARSGRGRR